MPSIPPAFSAQKSRYAANMLRALTVSAALTGSAMAKTPEPAPQAASAAVTQQVVRSTPASKPDKSLLAIGGLLGVALAFRGLSAIMLFSKRLKQNQPPETE